MNTKYSGIKNIFPILKSGKEKYKAIKTDETGQLYLWLQPKSKAHSKYSKDYQPEIYKQVRWDSNFPKGGEKSVTKEN